MKILRSFSFIFLVLLTISCTPNYTQDFPNQVETKKTTKHIRIQGSKVFGIFPKDYEYIKELARYQKHENLYIQVIDAPSSFANVKNDFTKEKIEAQGAKVDVLKNIKVNEFDAIYYEGPSKYQGETKLGIYFGDDSFLVIIMGVYKTDDLEGKREIQEILKTVFYEKEFEINPLELANFEFDLSITNFKYATTISNMFMYAENGKDDIQNETSNIMQFASLPQMTEGKAENTIKDMLWRYEKNGFTLENKNITKTMINSYPAFILETNIQYQNKNGILYQAILVGNQTTVLFISIAYTNLAENKEKYIETAQTIKIK